MFRDVGNKMNEVAEHKSEREMDSGCVSVWLDPLYIESSM